MKIGISVRNGNVEGALRKLKKQLIKDKKLMIVKSKQQYMKPSAKRRLAKAAAVQRWKKYEREQNPHRDRKY